jgi:hypothetical protein
MTARELFTVILMSIGTVWTLIAFAILVTHLVAILYVRQTSSYEIQGIVETGINLVCGLALFFSANRIAKLVRSG